MSQLSEARTSSAKRALIDSDADLEKAHVLAEKYYHDYVGRYPTMNEIHELEELVQKFYFEERQKKVSEAAKAYRLAKG